ncbi:ICOS ligand isoform X2 [Trachinotus anak]
MDEPRAIVALDHDSNTSYSEESYKGRTKTFVAEDGNNCSLYLTNITANDQGKYSCRFYIKGQYTHISINLSISANYRVCQNSSSDINGTLSDKTYWCDVKGRYREAEIQWYLDGQLLTNSSKTNITHTGPVGPSNGLYQFESKLITKLNGTPEPKCVVKAKGISPNISYYCEPNIDTIKGETQPKYLMRFFKIIPIVLVLGLSLVLWRCWKISQRFTGDERGED